MCGRRQLLRSVLRSRPVDAIGRPLLGRPSGAYFILLPLLRPPLGTPSWHITPSIPLSRRTPIPCLPRPPFPWAAGTLAGWLTRMPRCVSLNGNWWFVGFFADNRCYSKKPIGRLQVPPNGRVSFPLPRSFPPPLPLLRERHPRGGGCHPPSARLGVHLLSHPLFRLCAGGCGAAWLPHRLFWESLSSSC